MIRLSLYGRIVPISKRCSDALQPGEYGFLRINVLRHHGAYTSVGRQPLHSATKHGSPSKCHLMYANCCWEGSKRIQAKPNRHR